ncbi:TerB family tellurite resistance protein [Mariprofundus sp. EBB-1]|uniref:tellurite resistance TerB family protein n=1 Tax=Mariprofundus sp. EBB-1 TaxID=2650971 RepID=UPI001F305EC6|nr:TerB family tellurite resistance protein [Mariprofundus sp. EBB-1]
MLKTIQGWWRREEGAQQRPELTLAITKLMVGMMSMDGKIDDDEQAEIVKLLGEQFELTTEESSKLIEQARDTSRADLRIDLVVDQIIDQYNVEERTAMLAKLWRVAMADGNVAFLEEQYINRISGLIGVPSDALAELKARQEDNFPELDQSGRFQHPDPVKN